MVGERDAVSLIPINVSLFEVRFWVKKLPLARKVKRWWVNGTQCPSSPSTSHFLRPTFGSTSSAGSKSETLMEERDTVSMFPINGSPFRAKSGTISEGLETSFVLCRAIGWKLVFLIPDHHSIQSQLLGCSNRGFTAQPAKHSLLHLLTS